LFAAASAFPPSAQRPLSVCPSLCEAPTHRDREQERSMTKGQADAKNATRDKPRLLSGGNPQIPKGEGDGPVQDYIAAMPDWKSQSEEHTSELQSREKLVCRLLLEKNKEIWHA